MSTDLDPIVGNWYRYAGKGGLFRVVAVDEDRDLLEIQHFDGDVEELERSGWADLDVEAAEPPEDWTGPVDDVETDDLGYSETEMRPSDWRESLQSNRPSGEEWEGKLPEDEREDGDDGQPSEQAAR
ncbi:MAG: hypothetical protein EHM50_10175 [Lysobacterales bacterium]|nr:MAG: hypothetical protein EHM50_10175 [Xanthomonadales bacterium]